MGQISFLLAIIYM